MAVSVGSPRCFSVPFSVTTVPSQQSVASESRRSIFSFSFPVSGGTAFSSPSAHTAVSVMRFCVSVPVLSEQMTEALPSASTAGRRRISAFLPAMRWTPMASTIVTMTGNPSGMAETASETATINMESGGMRLMSPTTKMMPQAASARIPRYLPSCASFCCSGVCVFSAFSNRSAILPISVSRPVAVTTASAVP